jgi:hypothetical protein
MKPSPISFHRVGKAVVQLLALVGRTVLPFLLAFPLLTFVYLKATNTNPVSGEGHISAGWAGLPLDYVSFEWLAIFSSAMFLGALGSTVSFFARHEPQDELKKPRTLMGTQLLGALFASVLLFTFIGGLVQGSLFPHIGADSWSTLSFRVPEWCKLLVWSFIAGFSDGLFLTCWIILSCV